MLIDVLENPTYAFQCPMSESMYVAHSFARSVFVRHNRNMITDLSMDRLKIIWID